MVSCPAAHVRDIQVALCQFVKDSPSLSLWTGSDCARRILVLPAYWAIGLNAHGQD